MLIGVLISENGSSLPLFQTGKDLGEAMEIKKLTRSLFLATSSVVAMGGLAIAEESTTVVTDSSTTPPATTTDAGTGSEASTSSDDTTDIEEAKQGPGASVSTQAKLLQDVDGPRKDAAKDLRSTTLANNAGYQAAVAKRTSKPGEDEEDEAKGSGQTDHPTADDHPGKDDHPDGDDNPGVDDHPTPDDHPDDTDNTGDLAAEDHGKPDDLPEPDDHPGKDDHPTGRPGGG